MVLEIQESPDTSLRQIATNHQVSHEFVHYIKKKKRKVKPYIPRKVHPIKEAVPLRRIAFCSFFLNQLRQDPIYYRRMIQSDECTFSKMGFLTNDHVHSKKFLKNF